MLATTDFGIAMKAKRNPTAARVLSLLSEREVHVFRSLARGESMTSIAQRLGVTHSTIGTHRRRILAKLGIDTTAELVLVGHAVGFNKAPRIAPK